MQDVCFTLLAQQQTTHMIAFQDVPGSAGSYLVMEEKSQWFILQANVSLIGMLTGRAV